MSVTLTAATDAVPAHALRRGTRGFAAVVLFLTGMIVFAVSAFVLPSIALPSTLLTALILDLEAFKRRLESVAEG